MGKFKDADLTIKTIKLFPDLKKKLRKGTISTIETPAKKFVDIRSRVKKAGGYAMGGEATESLRKGQIFKEKRDKRRKEVDEMIERLYGPGIKPKKKPKNLDKIRPKTKPKKPQESIMTQTNKPKVKPKSTKKARKDMKTKIDAYKKVGKQKYDKGFTPDMSEKVRKSFKKTRVKKKNLVDIAGVIKSTGDRYLGTLGNLKTRFKNAKTAKKAGAFKKKK